ncbi:MAG: hypothetical protein ACPGLY_27190 [Rubripirellula sp.]
MTKKDHEPGCFTRERMIDFREIIADEMKSQGRSAKWLAESCGFGPEVIKRYLNFETDNLGAIRLALILTALNMKVVRREGDAVNH